MNEDNLKLAVSGMEISLSMSKKFAVLENNVVVNLVICDDEASAIENFGTNPGFSVVEEIPETTGVANYHYTWDGEKFNYGEAPQEPTVEETVDDQSEN